MTHRKAPFVAVTILLALLATCLFAPGLGGGFILDDRPNIVENASLHVATLADLPYAAYSFQPGHGSRSLSMLSFAFDYWRGAQGASDFKTTNLAVHTATIVAFCLLTYLLLSLAAWPARYARAGALALSLLWGIHPLQVSTVLYVVQRMQMLCTLFVVLAMAAYVVMRQRQLEGRSGRLHGVLTVLCWLLAFAGKEDAVLLPAYTLALELTFFRFRAAHETVGRALRYIYATATGTAAIAFAYLLPRYWHTETIIGREFSTPERLLSQGRVLSTYLGEILLPLPAHMPFYYDGFPPSRSLLQPYTTLPALLLVAGLIGWAWAWRSKRPLFAFGLMFFFAGHALTSNVLNLELAFEHRNYLPLAGILLALADLGSMALTRVPQNFRVSAACGAICAATLVLATGTVARAHTWGDRDRFARDSLRYAPKSARAWMELSAIYADRSKGRIRSTDFARAIDLNRRGAEATGSPALWSNVVIYETRRGTVTEIEWNNLLASLRTAPANPQNQGVAWVMLDNVDRGLALDEKMMLRLLSIAAGRGTFDAPEYIRVGRYVYNQTHFSGQALPYFEQAASMAPAGDPELERLLQQLDDVGRGDWAAHLRRLKPSRQQ